MCSVSGMPDSHIGWEGIWVVVCCRQVAGAPSCQLSFRNDLETGMIKAGDRFAEGQQQACRGVNSRLAGGQLQACRGTTTGLLGVNCRLAGGQQQACRGVNSRLAGGQL